MLSMTAFGLWVGASIDTYRRFTRERSGIEIESFDSIYEGHEQFEDVYEAILHKETVNVQIRRPNLEVSAQRRG